MVASPSLLRPSTDRCPGFRFPNVCNAAFAIKGSGYEYSPPVELARGVDGGESRYPPLGSDFRASVLSSRKTVLPCWFGAPSGGGERLTEIPESLGGGPDVVEIKC